MPKQKLNSFKELSGLLSELNLPKSPVNNEKNKRLKSKKSNKAPLVTKTSVKKPSIKQHPSKQVTMLKKDSSYVKINKPLDPALLSIIQALNWLKSTFPKAFITAPAKVMPLKIGIGHDITEFIKNQSSCEFSLTIVRKALAMYTRNFRYLCASIKVGACRIDLDGNPAGEITVEQADYAKNKLNALKQRQKKAVQDVDNPTPQIENVTHHE